MKTHTYYTSTQYCEDEQQADETIFSWFTDVDLWEEGAPVVFVKNPEGLSGTIVKFELHSPLPDSLWSAEYNGWYINPKLWNRTYSFFVEDTEIVDEEM